MNNIADHGCRQQGLSIVAPMKIKLSRFLLSSSQSMIDTRISRDPDGCPTISKRNMHLHIATIFPDKGTNFNILSIGQNIARNEYKSCHAEHEAINKLKNRNTKQLMGINIYVLRTTLTELNFVKPPMVDREGVIMCPNDVNMFGVASKFHNYRTQGRSLTITEHGYQKINSSLTGLNKNAKKWS